MLDSFDPWADPMKLMPPAWPAPPRLLARPGHIERTNRLAADSPPMAAAKVRLLQLAQAPLTPLRAMEQDTALFKSVADHGQQCAMAWLMTGEERYFQSALAIMRNMASVYMALPDRSPGIRAMGDDIAEQVVCLNMARTFDALHAAKLESADRQLMEALLRQALSMVDAETHRDCGNHNSSALMTKLALGIALTDERVVYEALYGNGVAVPRAAPTGQSPGKPDLRPRYGLVHQLRHDFLPDGPWWERTPGYHIYPLYVFAEVAWQLANLGVDLWHKTVPLMDHNQGQDLHGDYSSGSQTRTLQAAFDALIYWALPNLDLPLVHDGILANLKGCWQWGPLYELASDVYGDPQYAWLVEQAESTQALADRPCPGVPMSLQNPVFACHLVRPARGEYRGGRFDWRQDADFAITGRHRAGCSLFPDSGIAVLRNEKAGLSLHWGAHAAGHMSPASLHVDLFAPGGRVTDGPRSGGYDDLHLTWYRTTIAHNTVTVDQRPMYPYHKPTESIWEADNWHGASSAGRLETFDPGLERAWLRAGNAQVYTGVDLDRTLLLQGDVLLDVFRVCSDDEHVYDWAWHPLGRASWPAGAKPIDLGRELGYRHLLNAALLSPPTGSHTLDVTFASRAGASGGLSGCVALPAGAQAMMADDPPLERSWLLGLQGQLEPRTGLIVRCRAKDAVFISVWRVGHASKPLGLRVLRGQARGDVEVEIDLGQGWEKRWFPGGLKKALQGDEGLGAES